MDNQNNNQPVNQHMNQSMEQVDNQPYSYNQPAVSPYTAGQQPYNQPVNPQFQSNQQINPQFQNNQPVNPQFQSNQSVNPESEKHTANIMCIISLVCMFVVPITTFAFLLIINGDDNASEFLSSIVSIVIGLSHLAAWVLMILVRVKYRHSTFGKILMIIYLIILALSVIAVILIIASCISCMQQCKGF